jgi:tRNA A-37 threonylcarbamoyl transferase component Bud32
MKDIDELINKSEIYRDVSVQRKFKSKKNTVAYVLFNGKPCIIKWYAPGFKRNMEVEYNTLIKGSAKLNMPSVISKDLENFVIVMNYFIGENLCDVINGEKTSFDENKRLMYLLAEWFSRFHNYFNSSDGFIIRGDSSLRNFILNDRICGVDFEESRKGMPVEDIACLCSSILTTDPMFTYEKYNLCRIFIKSYKDLVKWNLENIWEEISYALLRKIQWRPDDEKILREHSLKIRKQGI